MWVKSTPVKTMQVLASIEAEGGASGVGPTRASAQRRGVGRIGEVGELGLDLRSHAAICVC